MQLKQVGLNQNKIARQRAQKLFQVLWFEERTAEQMKVSFGGWSEASARFGRVLKSLEESSPGGLHVPPPMAVDLLATWRSDGISDPKTISFTCQPVYKGLFTFSFTLSRDASASTQVTFSCFSFYCVTWLWEQLLDVCLLLFFLFIVSISDVLSTAGSPNRIF